MPVRMKHCLPRGLTRIRSHIPAADLRRLGTELLPPLPQQLPLRAPYRLARCPAIGHMSLRILLAVARRHWIGIGDAKRQIVFLQYPATPLQRTEHTAPLAQGVAGLQAAEIAGVSVALVGIHAKAESLQVAEVVGNDLDAMHDVLHLQTLL